MLLWYIYYREREKTYYNCIFYVTRKKYYLYHLVAYASKTEIFLAALGSYHLIGGVMLILVKGGQVKGRAFIV